MTSYRCALPHSQGKDVVRSADHSGQSPSEARGVYGQPCATFLHGCLAQCVRSKKASAVIACTSAVSSLGVLTALTVLPQRCAWPPTRTSSQWDTQQRIGRYESPSGNPPRSPPRAPSLRLVSIHKARHFH